MFWAEHTEADARSAILSFAQQAHLIKITDEEAEWLCDIAADDALSQPSKVRQQFPRCQGVLVTGGPKGAAFDVLGHTGRVQSCEVEVVETTGAGDAFFHCWVPEMLGRFPVWNRSGARRAADREREKQRVSGAVEFACAVGALTCTSEGAIAAQPTLQQVNDYVSRVRSS